MIVFHFVRWLSPATDPARCTRTQHLVVLDSVVTCNGFESSSDRLENAAPSLQASQGSTYRHALIPKPSMNLNSVQADNPAKHMDPPKAEAQTKQPVVCADTDLSAGSSQGSASMWCG